MARVASWVTWLADQVGNDFRKEVVQKGVVYLNVVPYILWEMQDAVNDCAACKLKANVRPLHARAGSATAPLCEVGCFCRAELRRMGGGWRRAQRNQARARLVGSRMIMAAQLTLPRQPLCASVPYHPSVGAAF